MNVLLVIGLIGLAVVFSDLCAMRKAYKEHDVIGVIYWGLLSLCIISMMS